MSDLALIQRALLENTSLRHKFRQESHRNRPDVIVHLHDIPNCELCRLCELASSGLTHGDGLQTVDSQISPLSAAVPESQQ